MAVIDRLSPVDQDLRAVEVKKHAQYMARDFKVLSVRNAGQENGRDTVEVTYQKKDNLSTTQKGVKLFAGVFANPFRDKSADNRKQAWNDGVATYTERFSYIEPKIGDNPENYKHSIPNIKKADLDSQAFLNSIPSLIQNDFVPKLEQEKDKLSVEESEKKYGYAANNQDSVKKFAARLHKKGELIAYPGDHSDKGWVNAKRGQFIVCPDGKIENAVCFGVVDAKTGKPVRDKQRLLRAMYDYSVSRDQLESAIDKAADKLVDEMHPDLDAAQRKKKKAEIEKGLKTFTFGFDIPNGKIYILSHPSSGIRTGIELEGISKDTWKMINRIHNKKEVDSRIKLDGVAQKHSDDDEDSDDNSLM